jgi:hypothetical protein
MIPHNQEVDCISPKSATVKLPTKALITRGFFAPLRTKDKDTETAGAENGAGGPQKIG